MKVFQNRYSAMFRRAKSVEGFADQCPTGNALSDLADGRAWPWQRRRLVGHLAHCSDCADDFRVLTCARDGLSAALESHAGETPNAAAWHRPALAATALAAFAALGISVLVGTGGPGGLAEPGPIFAGDFEPQHSAQDTGAPQRDRLFTSDFGASGGDAGRLFRDDFGG